MSLPDPWPLLQWREPLWLLLALYPLLVGLIQCRGKHHRLFRYADRALLPWLEVRQPRSLRQRLLSRDSSYVLAWLLFAIAAAGPRVAEPQPGQESRSGLDIMIVLDVSRSMQATDVRPSRLQRARIEIHELLSQAPEARLGLIVYSARPHLFVPLTFDKQALGFYLEMLDALVLPTYGSDAASALQLAARELAGNRQASTVLLISDGDLGRTADSKRRLFEAAQDLRQAQIPLFVLGVGSVEGDAIPLAKGGWLKQDGRAVISRMDETLLQQLAGRGGGKYQAVTEDSSDWLALYDHGMQAQARLTPADRDNDQVVWKEYFPWALLPAILLLFVASLPYPIPRLVPQRDSTSRMPLLLLAILGLSLLAWPGNELLAAETSSAKHAAAWQAFQAQDYRRAQELYETLPGYPGRFGEGASRYRQGDFAGAVRQFGQAALLARNAHQRGQALYNLGNSYVQLGNFRLASEVYEDALRYIPGHPASRKNLATSLALQARVEERLKNDLRSGRVRRAGKGPRRARAETEIQLDESSTVSLAEQQEGKATTGALPALPEPGDRQLAALIDRGVEHARLAAQGSSTGRSASQTQALIEARIQMEQLYENRAGLWKRLFEMEEGFPAPLQTPRQVPGVKPW